MAGVNAANSEERLRFMETAHAWRQVARLDENDIKIILEEFGDIWPMSILPTSDGCVVFAF